MKLFIAKLYTVQMIAIIPMNACFQNEGSWKIKRNTKIWQEKRYNMMQMQVDGALLQKVWGITAQDDSRKKGTSLFINKEDSSDEELASDNQFEKRVQ